MGTLERIIILHGWVYSTEKWQPILQKLEQEGFSCEMLHVPGLTDGTEKEWTLDDYVEWLKKSLAKEKTPVVLMGHSNGGRISLAFTDKYPDLVKHLILVDSAGIYPKGLKVRIKRAVFGTAAKVGKKLTSSNTLRRLLYKLARERDYRDATPTMRKTMANLISVDLTPHLPHIKVPTTIIWGAQDRSTPLADGKLMQEKIPHATLFVIPDANHSPHYSHPDLVAKYVSKALHS